MDITASEHENAIRRYRAILDGMGLDTGLAEGCAQCEINGGDPLPALRRIVGYQATLSAVKDNPREVMPQARRDETEEELRTEIENIMLYGKGTAEYHRSEPPAD